MTSKVSLFQKFREVGAQGAVYGFGAFTQRLVALVLIPVYTSVLTSAEYGILGLIWITGQISGTVFALGLKPGFLRSFFDYEDEEERQTVFSTVLILTLVSSVILLVCGFLCAESLAAAILEKRSYHFYFVIVFLSTAFGLLNSLVFALFRAKQQAGRYVLLQISSFLLRVGLIIYLVAILRWGILGALLGQLAASILSLLFLFWLAREQLVFRFSRKEAVKMARYGVPLAFVGVFGLISTYVDRYVLNYFTSLADVGLYTLAYQIGMLLTVLLIAPVKLVWGPALLSIKDKENYQDFCRKALTYLLFIGGFFFLAISLLAKELIQSISAPEYLQAYKVVPIIALTYWIWSSRSVVEVGVILKRKTTAIAAYTFIGALLNFVLNIVLIPRFGIPGAAWATFISFTTTIGIDYVYNQRLIKLNYEWGRIAKIAAAGALVFAIGWLYPISGIWLSIAFKGALVMLYPVILLGLGFYRAEEVRHIKELLCGLRRRCNV